MQVPQGSSAGYHSDRGTLGHLRPVTVGGSDRLTFLSLTPGYKVEAAPGTPNCQL